MQYKNVKFALDGDIAEDGTFAGLASTYGNRDLGGDLIYPGAFTKTIRENKGRFPLLFGHSMYEPIGDATVEDGDRGLNTIGSLELVVQRAKEAYALAKRGVLRGLSIGYDVIKQQKPKDQNIYGRDLTEIKLWEISMVVWGMNPKATITDVKAAGQLIVLMPPMESKDVPHPCAVAIGGRVALRVVEGALEIYPRKGWVIEPAFVRGLSERVTPAMIEALAVLQDAGEPFAEHSPAEQAGIEPELLHSMQALHRTVVER